MDNTLLFGEGYIFMRKTLEPKMRTFFSIKNILNIEKYNYESIWPFIDIEKLEYSKI